MVKTRTQPQDSHINTHVVGVTFNRRQQIIRNLPRQPHAVLIRELRNQHDKNAMAVVAEGKHVGYLPAEIAEDIAPIVDTGQQHYAIQSCRVMRPTDDFPRYGLWLELVLVNGRMETTARISGHSALSDYVRPIMAQAWRLVRMVLIGLFLLFAAVLALTALRA